jgi:DNA polymerase-3 subunit delta'
MPFADILGHQAIIDGLRAAKAHDRVAHAYLFAGPEGIGKSLVATAFAQLLCCPENGGGSDGCGRCRTCRLLAEGRHPDLITLEPEGAFIKISQVREMIKILRYPPVEAAYRVVIIEPADTLHPAAANALLKTLEEPSLCNIFILVTNQPHALLATIRSRAQQVRFSMLERQLVVGWLVQNAELDEESAHEVAAISGGSVGLARDLSSPQLQATRSDCLALLMALRVMSLNQVILAAEKLASAKKELPAVMDVIRLALRDLLLKSVGATHQALTFQRFAADFGAAHHERLMAGLDHVDEAEDAIRHNVNPRLVTENLLISLGRVLGP